MLLELRIHNIAIIDDLNVALGPGLTVLTGETGSGKSVIAGSLGLLAGGAADPGLVRKGEELGFVEGVFDLEPDPAARALATRMGLRVDGDGILVLRRELRPAGRDRVLCNGMISSLAVLRQLGGALLAIQSQDQQRELARPDFARTLLDHAADTGEELAAVANARKEYLAAADKLREVSDRMEAGRQQEEMWRYQLEELDHAGLDADEEALLAEKLHFGRNARALLEAAGQARDLIEAGEPSSRSLLGAALAALAKVGESGSRLEEIMSLLRDAEASLDEAAHRLTAYLDACEVDPRSLDELEQRKALYEDLQRKYRRDVGELLRYAETLRAHLEFQDHAADEVEACRRELREAATALGSAAAALHRKRHDGAEVLAGRLEEILRPLGLPDLRVRLEVELNETDEGGIAVSDRSCVVAAHGADTVRLLVRTNPGAAFGPVHRIASGGERSRIFLGISVLDTGQQVRPLRLFDEIDAGLGMEGAAPVAGLLQELARRDQVLCITHLATVAARGNRHLRITKQRRGSETAVRVKELEAEERVAELTRLLGGEAAVTDTSDQEAFARRLYEEGGAG